MIVVGPVDAVVLAFLIVVVAGVFEVVLVVSTMVMELVVLVWLAAGHVVVEVPCNPSVSGTNCCPVLHRSTYNTRSCIPPTPLSGVPFTISLTLWHARAYHHTLLPLLLKTFSKMGHTPLRICILLDSHLFYGVSSICRTIKSLGSFIHHHMLLIHGMKSTNKSLHFFFRQYQLSP